MKKHLSFLFFSLLTLLFLNGCASTFPSVRSFYISPFELTTKEKEATHGLALSPDGEVIAIGWIGGQNLANLQTGERIDLVERLGLSDLEYANRDIISGDQIFWSSDGRYLGMTAKHYETGGPTPTGWVFYRFDLQTKTAERYEIHAYAFSPFDSNKVLTENGVYDLRNGTLLPFIPDFDFRQEKRFKAIWYWDLLWSTSIELPVAQILTLPHNATPQDDIEIVVESSIWPFFHQPTYRISTGFISKRPNQLSGYFFDPTGEYILVSEWQCRESPTPCTITPFHANNVYDTVLTLVRWRTQEKRELIRLSAIDPEHVVAYGYMAWSADGSTIFISRKDALPIVLKVKYP